MKSFAFRFVLVVTIAFVASARAEKSSAMAGASSRPSASTNDCKPLSDCAGLGNNCKLRQDRKGCPTCFCEDACPDVFCGTQCRRVLTEGHCPFCDCRRGKQVYVKGVRPSPRPFTLRPYTERFDYAKKEEFN